MPHFVEDAGEPLSAGWLSRFVRATGLEGDALAVGDRDVEWELTDEGLNVTHAPAHGRRRALRYAVELAPTVLPSGGARWWWSCPTCGARVDALYLPKCCGLTYRSQSTGKKRRRKRRSVGTAVRERWKWTAATGTVLLSRKRVSLERRR